ncbi:DUF3289 family protein [Inconstantimicrobium mannanitabidum]|uniref:Uncharacterized protein n=1 Tax=Inconstantimicrobium mannanitabidum TaxID=1604901 RepID=A0ACB5RIQ8_9CLOT|nr:DUF3289 family protein [Clostridium sp. TW13]GKX68963.1 hypothetical protein rsdtw13_42210 [Clostridium sp. TW13]
MSNVLPNITPGDVVPGGFTYPNNAQLVGDFLYLRDADGNGVGGHQVDAGDKITVLDIGFAKQLALVQYPAGNVVRQGYINNNTNIIKYFNQGKWNNGSTSETVYNENDVAIGSIDPHEAATPLYKAGGKIHVVYNTSKGANTKSGYVAYDGGFSGFGGSSGLENGVAPGDVVPGGFTYPNNAQLVGDFLYLRDANGNGVGGHQVDTGDKVTVLDVGYTKQLVLLQYPAGNVVRQGYVNNDTKIIQYFNQGQWHNGSTSETVYDENNVAIGSLDPHESATPIYKRNGMTHVVYNTDKGANTKSGFVKYEGGSSSSSGLENGVAPGDVVPGGFTYPNNAQLVGDFLYLRDANGNGVSGHQVDTGDKVTVLDVGYTKQLVLLQYPAGNVVRQGYVNNDTKIIKYFNEGQWHNGSTSETVYDENNVAIGSLDPYESATPIYKRNGMTHVVYNTDKGANTKSGFVKYEGGSAQVIDIPYVTVAGADKIQYGTSGKGRPLIAHKIGSGSNSLVMVCEVHGFEDHWSKDGIELVNIGNDLIKNLVSSGTNGWSVYVIPSANPDGLAEGYTKDGPGRCTIVGQIDINRDFPVGFTHNTSSRNYTDSTPLTVPESKQLSEFLQGVKNSTLGQMVVIDLHGWEGAAIGNPEIGQYFRNQFGFEQRNGYGEDQGYLIAWTNSVLGAKSALIELPTATYSHSDVVSGNYSQKITNAVNAILAIQFNNIKQLQADLKTLGIYSGVISGIYDKLTEFAVKEFQLRYSIIPANGVVTNETLIAIKKAIDLDNIKYTTTHALVYQSARRKGLNEDGSLANDMKINDFSKENLLAINSLFSLQIDESNNPEDLFKDLEIMAIGLFAKGEMSAVILDMINHFKSGKGEDYSNSILTKNVKEHDTTKDYIQVVTKAVISELVNNKGNLAALQFNENTKNSNQLYNYIQSNAKRPIFHSWSDILGGLTMAINDTWGNNIEVRNYSVSDNSFKGVLHFNIYDHFGLDKPDVEKNYVNLAGFRAWFVLQHYTQFSGKYKPFPTVIEFDVPFEGSY